MSGAGEKGKPGGGHDGRREEGALFRLLAPEGKSRPRLLLILLLLVVWIAFLIGLHLSTVASHEHPLPASSRMAMAFPR